MKSNYVDTSAIIQVIGCVFNNASILDETDKYVIHEEDFVEDFHKIVFGSIYNIHLTGSQVNIDAIIDYLANRPKYDAIFQQNKGVEYLAEASQIAQASTFNYYYNRLKKFSLLRAYDNFGLDVSYLYDPVNVLDTKKKQEQEDWLDNTSLVSIASSIDRKIDEIKCQYIEDDLGIGYQAGDGIVELVEDLEKHPEVGIPLYGPLINTVTRGARLRKFYLRSAATGMGKALPNDDWVPTPQGRRKVGDIRPGDWLIGQNGKPTQVLAIWPQERPKEIWEVIFSDGRIARCSKDHLWEYHDWREQWRVGTTEQMSKEEGLLYIKANEPVEYSEKNYYTSPFLMGIHLQVDNDYLMEHNFPNCGLRIPDEYKLGSIQQRRELLRGLGIESGKEFVTPSTTLSADIAEVAYSLGLYVESWQEMEFNVIHMFDNPTGLHAIECIKPTAMYTDMTCFTVDAPDHLFLMNDYIVTHNTRTMIADSCNFACNQIYHEQFGWIRNGTAEPTLFIATEQDKSEVQTMMLAFLSAVNEEHILNGQYLEGERDRVLKAAEILKNSPIWIEELPDFSLQDVENKIKKNIREHDIKYVVFDYVQTSLKILEEITSKSGGVKLREDNILFMLSARLKDLANKYGIFILSGTQLNASYQSSETPDQNLLRGAKSIADRIDVGMILLSVTDEDLIKLDPILQSNPNLRRPNVKLSVYKNRRGSYKGVYLWCAADLGICRVEPQFCTDYSLNMVGIEDLKIMVDEGPSAWDD